MDFFGLIGDLLRAKQKNQNQEKNPFEDESGFENFLYFDYGKIQSKFLKSIDLNTPINIYKYMLVEVNEIVDSFTEISKKWDEFDVKLEELKKIEAKYKTFSQQNISMTKKEANFVKSAYAALKLTRIVIQIKRQKIGIKAFDYDGFKETCRETLHGTIGRISIDCLSMIFDYMSDNHCFEVCRFILCLITEILEIAEEALDTNKKLKANEIFPDMIEELREEVLLKKLLVTLQMLQYYDTFNTMGTIAEEKIPKIDQRGDFFMEILDNSESTDLFYYVPMKVVNFEQAKIIHEFILQLSKQLEDPEDTKFYQAVAHSYFAGFQQKPMDVYRMCEVSNEAMAMGPRKFIEIVVMNDKDINKIYLIKQMLDLNYSRMWKIDYQHLQKQKTTENFRKLKYTAQKRVEAGKSFFLACGSRICARYLWWTHLDIFKCKILALKNEHDAKENAAHIFDTLSLYPDEIKSFKKLFPGVKFGSGVTKEKFAKSLLQAVA